MAVGSVRLTRPFFIPCLRRSRGTAPAKVAYAMVGMSQPDHNTINRFRSDRLRDVLKEIFSQVVLLLVENGLINLKQVYLDGNKIEALNPLL